MRFSSPLIPARFLRRRQRFLAEVELTDGSRVWVALGERLVALDPASGETTRTLPCAGDAGTAFDGKHLYQIAEAVIRKIDPGTGEVLATIPAPGNGRDSGLAWADGTLWVGSFGGVARIKPS